MKNRTLQRRRNNAYDSILLIEDGKVIGAWEFFELWHAGDWDNPGNLNYWDATSLDDGEEIPEQWGDLVAEKTNEQWNQ